MRAFMRGAWTVVRTVIAALAIAWSNVAGNEASGSWIRNLARTPACSRSIGRLRACWIAQSATGCVVAPSTRTRLVACSIIAST